MGRHHLVRVGALGHVGRFTAVDPVRYPRHARVILRTGRGLEVGEILSSPDESPDPAPGEGSILRRMTVEDELLEARLQRNKQAAFEACAERLARLEAPATLMDVEHLFDGRTLLFYFLGEITAEVAALTSELADVYEAQAQFRKFAETLSAGCGPDCGTERAAGGGCKTCATGCAVASACATHRH